MVYNIVTASVRFDQLMSYFTFAYWFYYKKNSFLEETVLHISDSEVICQAIIDYII